jgi:DNA-binding CsgD family transcriptional regulator/tetratricopeptide (TPR) repeat protein
MAESTTLIGRDRELARLLAAVARRVRLLLVTGDAGVGKTRFTSEGLARAAATGVVVMRGECLPLAGTLPLLPVAAALGELAAIDGGALLAAALAATPPYVRGEVARLLPRLDDGEGPVGDGLGQEWQRARLFSAVAELLAAVAAASGSRVGLLVEDMHWADSATLDCVTFLGRAGQQAAVTVVATCRTDEAPVAAHVSDWLAQTRADARVEEIRLGPLPRPQADDLAAALAGSRVPPEVADELYARAEGNPFFTEQMLAAALEGARGTALAVPAEIPARLAHVLAARARRCDGAAQAVLAALAVTGRPVVEDMLDAITGLEAGAVRGGLRQLTESRLLAGDSTPGTYRPRHALLAEAIASQLLPGERAALHERVAAALTAAGDDELAAEAAGHWQAAGLPADELPARVTAAAAAERVFGYAESAAHCLRAIELCDALPATDRADLPRLYLRAIDALTWSGDGTRAGAVAEEARKRFAGHPDPAVAAAVCHRAAFCRAFGTPDNGLDLIEEALRLYAKAPPSAGHAEALYEYADTFLRLVQGPLEDIHAALQRALELAEATGAAALVPRALASLARNAFRLGRLEEGHAFLRQGRARARVPQDAMALVWLALSESFALLHLARFEQAAEVAQSALEPARQAGLGGSWPAAILAFNACDALLARGQTAAAAALIDPLTAGPSDLDHWAVHGARAEIDLLRGEIDAASHRWRLLRANSAFASDVDLARESVQRAAELAVWAGRPAEALAEAQQALGQFINPDLAIFCGRLLATGVRACADLAERARARGDDPAVAAASAAADGLASWAGEQMRGTPFAEHPFVAMIPAERATWDAERTRLAGSSDPDSWSRAANTWQEIGCPHRAGYAWWREAEARLDRGRPAPAAVALRAAAAAADGHAPLMAQVRALARRARIPLHPAAAVRPSPPVQAPYGLTSRELAALRLLAAGHTNAQIAAALYISPSTAGVHVTSILRKLGVSGRVQAAALAERAGLLGESG